VNPHDEQKITSRDEVRKAREAKRASAAAFLPANDRFKQSYASLTYLCVIVATVAHFAIFEFFPKLEAADLGVVSDEAPAAAKQLVLDINAKRKVRYAEIAKQNGTSVDAVAALAGEKLIERTPPGEYVMGVDVRWQKKK